jgi:hypothetical protein
MHLTIRSAKDSLRRLRDYSALPERARSASRRDNRLGLGTDPGIDASVAAALGWLARAQDCSVSRDGGVARHYSLISGWATSYPETTGYIIPTVLDADAEFGMNLRTRGKRMLDWLVSIQFPEGGFQGGMIHQTPVVPVTFNTGQILIGLAAGVRVFGEEYRPAMRKAADWLANSLDADGCWRKHPTPFAGAGEKAYETHVSWGLFEAARLDPSAGWQDAAVRQVNWALTKQRSNGWFESNCLGDYKRPLTHTIGYVLRGIVEAYRFTRDERYLEAAMRCAEGACSAIENEGRLPGKLDENWAPANKSVCVTGSVQIAHSCLLLYQATGNQKLRDAGFALNRYARRTIALTGDENTRGGVRGSFPVSGDYGTYEYLNWAAKFFIDSNLVERSIRANYAT